MLRGIYCKSLAVVAGLTVTARAHAQEHFEPIPGPVVVNFATDPFPEDEGVGAAKVLPFGVFRDNQPVFLQFIEQNWKPIHARRGGPLTGFLVLSYNVSGPRTYNGWWVKLGNADWTRYRRGELVLRLRQCEPRTKKEISIEDPDTGKPLPDTQCTDDFKVELKVNAKGNERKFALAQKIDAKHKEQQTKQGYFDLRIPVSHFSLNRYLDNVAEFVIVFENRSILKEQARGNLGVHAIVLTADKGEDIDEILERESKSGGKGK